MQKILDVIVHHCWPELYHCSPLLTVVKIDTFWASPSKFGRSFSYCRKKRRKFFNHPKQPKSLTPNSNLQIKCQSFFHWLIYDNRSVSLLLQNHTHQIPLAILIHELICTNSIKRSPMWSPLSTATRNFRYGWKNRPTCRPKRR